MTLARIERCLLRLVALRYPKSICPSEVARALCPDNFRSLIPRVRDVAARLSRRGLVVITQRGTPVDLATARGPVRISVARTP